MSELNEKVQASIARLKAFEPRSGEGYYLAFSGGKDSVVIKALADMAGVKYDSTYRVTSVDPPELVRFIMEKHPDVKREVPRYPDRIKSENLRGKPITMWNLIPKEKYPPTRISRYCCRSLKESGGDGRVTVTGVRWAESRNRKENQGLVNIHNKGTHVQLPDTAKQNKSGGIILTNDNDDARRMVEQCYRRHKTTVNPIVDWSDAEVWEFIKAENIPYCGLYDDGFHRLGCIGCPMSRGGREVQFNRWPKYKDSYIRAFSRMLKEREMAGLHAYDIGKTGQDVFNWWMEYDILPGQTSMLESEEEEYAEN